MGGCSEGEGDCAAVQTTWPPVQPPTSTSVTPPKPAHHATRKSSRARRGGRLDALPLAIQQEAGDVLRHRCTALRPTHVRQRVEIDRQLKGLVYGCGRWFAD